VTSGSATLQSTHGLRSGLRWRALVAAGSCVLAIGCAIGTSEVVEPSPAGTSGDPDGRAEHARSLWASEPRSRASVEEAFHAMMEAVRATDSTEVALYERISDAARYAVWLSRRTEGDAPRAFAASPRILANTAVARDSARVEGYYWRAVAAGLIAREDALRGRSAMGRIREDARRAISLDPGFDDGGPHRVLGALYLRAPGPPAGVGSLRRALEHLEEGRRLAPAAASNLLFLAEAYLEDDRPDDAAALIRSARSRLEEEAPPDDPRWEHLHTLESRLRGSRGARPSAGVSAELRPTDRHGTRLPGVLDRDRPRT